MTYLASSMPARSIERICLAMKQLKATPINDVFARNGHIRADGRMVHDLYLVQVKAPDQIKEKWDYYTDEAFQPLSESRCRLVTR
ncbi:hypothetical protein V1289_005546 [Bradyrhizobium sp. AZCC 2289]